MNSCYKHFYFFVMEFELLDTKEFEPLVRRSGEGGKGGRGGFLSRATPLTLDVYRSTPLHTISSHSCRKN